MNAKNLLKEILILMSVSAVLAFTVNAVSPKGIAIVGQWDTSKGVISAKEKNKVPQYDLEIDNILDAKKIFDSKAAVFVDARSVEEFDEGHIKGAESLPLYSYDTLIEKFTVKYKPSTYLITYCSGRECEDSHELAQLLMDAGFENISVYIDGFPLWAERGYPVE